MVFSYDGMTADVDEERVFTPLNAHLLQAGDKVIVAKSPSYFKQLVTKHLNGIEVKQATVAAIDYTKENEEHPIYTKDKTLAYSYAYLVKRCPPLGYNHSVSNLGSYFCHLSSAVTFSKDVAEKMYFCPFCGEKFNVSIGKAIEEEARKLSNSVEAQETE